ncbi:MAG TPA: thioredoxin family protein [Anaerolineales bacterium]|nr:thioredoxin family protein [Anaerolineales bacterium]HNN13775.1 thioredoxin family protein [Anaerolineales bacterium]HNO31458.1 thioredoxin family protein [Anaerolineales bacterium]
MNTDILLRFGMAVVIIGLGLSAYWLFNQHLMGRAQSQVLSLVGTLPNKPMIVYFTTPECAPCKTVQRPALSKLLTLTGDSVQVIEIDAVQRPDLAKQWGVMSVPTTFLLDARGEARYVNNGVTRVEKLMEQLQTLNDFEI